MKRLKFFASVCAIGLAMSQPAYAQRVDYSGTIKRVFTSGPNNFAFRVTLSNTMAGCQNDFAYMNTDNLNYQATVATLLTAYSLNKTVILTVDSTPINGQQWCSIVDVAVL